MNAPRTLPPALKPYVSRMSAGAAFGVKRKVNGIVTSVHNGIDLPTPKGVLLVAVIDGYVSAVGGSQTHQWGYYLHITCRCPHKHTIEHHIMPSSVLGRFKVGDPIRLGQSLGTTWQSGGLNGFPYAPHHHLGYKADGFYRDPLSIGWPDLADGGAEEFDNTEDEMLDKDDMNLLLNTPAYTGGPTISALFKLLDSTPQKVAHAVWWESVVDRPLGDVAALQELADIKTIAARSEAQMVAMSAALGALAVSKGVDPEKLSATIAEKVDAALADNFAAIPDAVRTNIKGAL